MNASAARWATASNRSWQNSSFTPGSSRRSPRTSRAGGVTASTNPYFRRVEHHHVVPFGEQLLGDDAADEARPAGD